MRNIPDDNLAYPVLLKFDTGSSGSSFMLRTTDKQFLITAKHVLFDINNVLRGKIIELIAQTIDINDETTTNFSVDLSKVKIISHPSADISAIELGTVIEDEKINGCQTTYYDGVIITRTGNSKIVCAQAKESTKLLKDVLISNNIFLYGYPTSLGLKNSPQFNYNKPLMRTGIIANTNPQLGTIILDCPVYYGNSGGPVVEVDQDGLTRNHKIIGVVSQFIPFVEEWINSKSQLIQHAEYSNSGYSVAVAIDKVLELILAPVESPERRLAAK
jgi:hypothetical protein